MRRFRRFALAAAVLDTLLGVGGLLVMGEAAEARQAAAIVRYVPMADGRCGAMRATEDGAWHYDGLVNEAACAEASGSMD